MVWDDASATAIGTGTTTAGGCFSVSSTPGAIVPIDASAGEHVVTARTTGGGASTTFTLNIFYPDSLTLATTETDGMLNLGQMGVTLTATLLKDGAALTNAGVKLTLATVPGSCAGAALSPPRARCSRPTPPAR